MRKEEEDEETLISKSGSWWRKSAAVSSVVQDQSSGTESTEILPFDLETERQKAEFPLGFDVHRMHFPPTVRARSWSFLSS